MPRSTIIHPVVLLLASILPSLSATFSSPSEVPPAPPCGITRFFDGNVCARCPFGSRRSSNGYSCTRCPSARPVPASSSCISCPAGRFVADRPVDGTVCLRCPGDTISTRPNSRVCIPCPNNGTSYSVLGYSASSCRQCGIGAFLFRYQAAYSQCGRCPLSSIPSFHNRCTFCPHGHIHQPAMTPTCQPCPPGTFAKTPPRDTILPTGCFVCPWGTYAPRPGAASCRRCPPGAFSTPSRTECVRDCARRPWLCRRACGPGRAWSAPACACRRCARGAVSRADSVTECVPCTNGQRADSAGGRCVCPGGKALYGVGPYQQWRCVKCPSPFVKGEGYRCHCAHGAIGTRLPSVVLEVMKVAKQRIEYGCLCKAGWKSSFSPLVLGRAVTDKRRCVSIEKGEPACGPLQYVETFTGMCEDCPPGFKSSRDRRRCVRCTIDDVRIETLNHCSCPLGTVLKAVRGGAVACVACPAGTARGEREDRCYPCYGYRYAPRSGMARCKLCPRERRYGSAMGRRRCPAPCVGRRGIVQKTLYALRRCRCKSPKDVSRGGECVACEGLRVAGGARGDKCVCGGGGTELRGGACVLCRPGTARGAGEWPARCRRCAENTVAAGWGSERCVECERGKRSIGTGGTVCKWCPPGRFVTVTGECGRCGVGEYVRRGRCWRCPSGSVSAGRAAAFCRRCGEGKRPNKARDECL